jgi:hypothetical protein
VLAVAGGAEVGDLGEEAAVPAEQGFLAGKGHGLIIAVYNRYYH